MSIQEEQDGSQQAEVEFDAEAVFAEIQAEKAGQGSDLPGADKAKDEADPEAKTGQEESPPDKAAASDPEPEGKDTDIWATAPPALKAAYESERQARERWETTARGHARSASQLGRALAAERAKLPEGTEAPAGETDEQRRERESKLREDYPDFEPAFARIDYLERELAKVTGVVTAHEQGLTEADKTEQYRLLDGRHPDWRKEVLTEEYRTWAESQPEPVLEAIRKNDLELSDGATAAWVLDLWKRDMKPDPEVTKLADKRKEQLDASRAPNVKAPAATAKDAATDPEDIWKEAMAARERRRKTA